MYLFSGAKMFTYPTRLRLKDTDATGVLYFSEQFKFAMEAFEEFLNVKGVAWKELMASPYLLPVVHAEADYLAPLRVGDALEISLKVTKIGTSSITLEYTFYDPKSKRDVGRVQIVHVTVDKNTLTAVPIPDFLRKILEDELVHLDRSF